MGISVFKTDVWRGDLIMDLTLVPLEELYSEILNRFDHVIIGGIKVLPQEKKISRRWNGDHHISTGICADFQFMIIKDWYKN